MCGMFINERIAGKTNVHIISTAGLYVYFRAQVTSVTHITTAVAKYSNTDVREMLGAADSLHMRTSGKMETGIRRNQFVC